MLGTPSTFLSALLQGALARSRLYPYPATQQHMFSSLGPTRLNRNHMSAGTLLIG